MSEHFRNVYQMFQHTVLSHSDSPAYFENIQGNWVKTTWSDLKEQSDQFAMALLDMGLKQGETVSILAGNRLIWPIADLGTIASGGVSIGIYPTNSPEQCAYILNHSKSRLLVVDTAEQLAKILSIQHRIPDLQCIVVKEAGTYGGTEKIVPWEEFLRRGEDYRGKIWEVYQNIANNRNYEDIVIIVYTSGTTGNPKGACLSNRYVIASSQSLSHMLEETRQTLPHHVIEKYEGQPLIALSFLPFCHVAERISGMYARIYTAGTAYLVPDLTKLYQYMMEVNPHIFGGVPRFFEKIYSKILNEVETGRGYEKQEFYRAVEINRLIKEYQKKGQSIPDELLREYAWAEERVYQKVRDNFGKRILTCSSGAAPIPKEVLDMFENAGNLTLLEAYGLTEFVCCAFNTPAYHRVNSVGKPMYGCNIDIAQDGEILLKGTQMFSGYYRDELATQEVIDAEGWLHTGDIGKLDEDGFLFITGRKKEFIKTSTGKKIAPLYIENLCKRHHLISNVMVYGDNEKYLIALITLNAVELMAYAGVHSISYSSYAELTQHAEIKKIIDATIFEVNRQVSTTEQIKKYAILDRDFSIESDEITPTGKVKRKIVTEKFRNLITNMYV